MEPLIVLAALTTFACFASLLASRRRRARMGAWDEAARQAGLTNIDSTEGGVFLASGVRGRAGDLRVSLEEYRRSQYEKGTRIVISGLGHGYGGLSLRSEGFSTAVEKRVFGESEIEVGDPAFDAEYLVQGRAAVALAVLGPEARSRLARLLRGQVCPRGSLPVDVNASLSGDALRVEVAERPLLGGGPDVPGVLAVVLDVARLLVAPRDLPARLAANLAQEPEAGVRCALLLALTREFPKRPETRQALLAARGDANEDVRLRAATALGEDGRELLLDLVRGAGTGDACAARAVAALGEHLPAELAAATLRRALSAVDGSQTAQACLHALGRLRRPEHEDLLLEALAGENRETAVAAARALAPVGTVAAVAPLQRAAEHGGELKRAALQAIDYIQGRLVGAEPGQLSIATAEAGELALADGEEGRLSLASDAPPPGTGSRTRGDH